MGRDLAEAVPAVRELFAHADQLLGFPLTRTMFEGPAEALKDTALQQPALVLVSLGIMKAMEVTCGAPPEGAAAAGLSLGEYSALAATGALSPEDALRLVWRRGQLMKAAAEKNPGGLVVVIGLSENAAAAACAQAARETGAVAAPCNFNGGGQLVIGGAHAALARAIELCKQAGCRHVVKLQLSGAFHTALMQPAAEQLREALRAVPIRRARVPVYANVSALPVQEPGEIRDALERQLTSPVLWERTIRSMVSAGHRRFLELGPGHTLASIIRRIVPDLEAQSVGTWAQVREFALAYGLNRGQAGGHLHQRPAPAGAAVRT